MNIHPSAKQADASRKTLNLPPPRTPDLDLDGRSHRGIELGESGLVGEIGELSRYGRADARHEAIGEVYILLDTSVASKVTICISRLHTVALEAICKAYCRNVGSYGETRAFCV